MLACSLKRLRAIPHSGLALVSRSLSRASKSAALRMPVQREVLPFPAAQFAREAETAVEAVRLASHLCRVSVGLGLTFI